MDVDAAKNALRATLRGRRAALGATARAAAAARIGALTLGLAPLAAAGTVGLYAQIGDEVATEGLFAGLRRRGVRVCYPRVERGGRLAFVPVAALAGLRPGFAGIPEPPGAPVPLADLAALVLPCLGVDRYGGRLGSGHGLYDRAVADYRGACIGLAFAVQRLGRLPQAAWDRPLDFIVCEDGAAARQVAEAP